MPSPAEELRQAHREFAPAIRMAKDVLRVERIMLEAIAAADQEVTSENRRRELARQLEELEATVRRRQQGEEEGRQARLGAIEVEVVQARAEADEIKTRVGREAKDFIAAREADRKTVGEALVRERATLQATRAAAEQAEKDRLVALAADEQAKTDRRRAIEVELRPLEDKVAALRKEHREILDRLAAMTR